MKRLQRPRAAIRFGPGAWRDARRLRASHPQLAPTKAEFALLTEALKPAYDEYVPKFSEAGWAVSLETSGDLGRHRGSVALEDGGVPTKSGLQYRWARRLARLRETAPGPHDVVFHDLASGSLREESMQPAIACVRPGGVIVFDDAQHQGHPKRMYAEGSAARLELYSLRSWTLDSIGSGRWSILGVKA